jgi:hypothetical protein
MPEFQDNPSSDPMTYGTSVPLSVLARSMAKARFEGID